MASIADKLAEIRHRIEEASGNRKNVKLIAVSKTKPAEMVLHAFQAGQTRFGENRVQEARDKAPQLPPETDWHLIGPLQTNKAKYCPSIFSTIHTVHREEVAQALEKKCRELDKTLDILIQMNLGGESTKSGIATIDELRYLEDSVMECSHLRLTGLMTIGDPAVSEKETRRTFARLYEINQAEAKRLGLERQMVELSTGMSADFELALKEGATYIRIGSAIFGSRH